MNPCGAVIRIEAGRRGRRYLQECWRHREIVAFLARRDFIVRYRQTLLGVSWVVVKPLLSMVVFTIIFGTVARLPSLSAPYPLLVLCGLLPWQFFSSVVNECSISLVNNPNLITKIYFPRLLMPLSTLVLNFVDLAVNTVLLAAVMAWFRFAPTPRALLLPLPLVLMALLSFAVGIWVSALMVRYRDLKNVVPIFLQFGMLITPVAYTTIGMREDIGLPLSWNPLCAPIEWARWCIIPSAPMPGSTSLAISVATAALLSVSGYHYFRRAEGWFADVI